MSAKLTAKDMDAVLMNIARMNLRQLDRVDDAVHAQKMRKLGDGKADEGKPAASVEA